MKNENDAFIAGLIDGCNAYTDFEKVAEVFMQGLIDGAAAANHVPIMDKIAQLLDGTESVESAEQASAPTSVIDRIRALANP